MSTLSVPSHSGGISRSSSTCVQTCDEIELSKAPLNLHFLMGEQRPFACLHFTPSHQTVGDDRVYTLRMTQIVFGVEGCVQTTRELGYIIQEMDIKIQPAEGRAKQCKSPTITQSGYPIKFSIEDKKTWSAQVATTNPRHLLTLGCLRSTAVRYEEHACPWSALVQPRERSISWKWTLGRMRYGAVFPKVKPGRSKFVLGSELPTLPVDPKSFTYLPNKSEMEFEARWEVPLSCAKTLEPFKWDFNVTMKTMRFSKAGIWGYFGFNILFDHPHTLEGRGIYKRLRLRQKFTKAFEARFNLPKKIEEYLERKY